MSKKDSKSYKLIKEDFHHYEVLHPDGTSFKVAKKPLDEATHKKIRTLEYAHGGQVKGYDEGGGVAPQNLEQALGGVPDSQVESPELNVPSGSQGPNLTAPTMTPEQRGILNQPPPTPGSVTPESINKLSAEAENAQGTYSKKSKSSYDELLSGLGRDEGERITMAGEMAADYDKAYQQMSQNPIDAHRVWHNASTGQKLLAGLGVILGGVGSGMTGQSNLALDMINKTIDQDLEAQKSNMANKMNLLRMGVAKYKDLYSASVDSSNMKLKASQLYLDQLAKQASNPLQKLEIEKANLAIQNAIQQNTYSLAQRQQQLRAYNGDTDVNPMMLKGTPLEGTDVKLPSATGKEKVGFARDKESAQKLREQLIDYGNLNKTLDAMEANLKAQFGDVNENDTSLNVKQTMLKHIPIVKTGYAETAESLKDRFNEQFQRVLTKSGRFNESLAKETASKQAPDINQARLDLALMQIRHARERLAAEQQQDIEGLSYTKMPKEK